jgi:hypothetical protein
MLKAQMERSDIPLFRKSSWATAGRTRLDFLERELKVQGLKLKGERKLAQVFFFCNVLEIRLELV